VLGFTLVVGVFFYFTAEPMLHDFIAALTIAMPR